MRAEAALPTPERNGSLLLTGMELAQRINLDAEAYSHARTSLSHAISALHRTPCASRLKVNLERSLGLMMKKPHIEHVRSARKPDTNPERLRMFTWSTHWKLRKEQNGTFVVI